MLAGALLLVLCSCGGGAGEPEHEPDIQTGAAPALGAPAILPASIAIPAIDAHSTLVPLGLTAQGELAAPPVDRPLQAGYFAGRDVERVGDEVLPGEVGPAVIAAHVDGTGPDGCKGFPGLFHDLPTLQPGADVLVDREDGSTLRFVVQRVERFAKAAFPTAQVYGDTAGPELRLITCGGAFDRAAGHYEDNWVAFAALA